MSSPSTPTTAPETTTSALERYKSITTALERSQNAGSHLPFTTGVEIENIFLLPAPEPFSDEDPYAVRTHINALEYLQSRFAVANLDSTTSTCPHDFDFDYSDWLITYDGSLDTRDISLDVLREKLPALFSGTTDEEEAKKPDFQGVELVSPPLPVPDVNDGEWAVHQKSLCDVKRYLDVLVNKPSTVTDFAHRHGAFASSACGLHVHIGLPDSRPIPLPILQQLAFLLLKYEDVLSSLHHYSRTPYPGMQASQYAMSNRLAFCVDGHTAGCVKSLGAFDLEKARTTIFAEGMTTRQLAWMMGADVPLGPDGREIVPGSEKKVEEKKTKRKSGSAKKSEGATNQEQDGEQQVYVAVTAGSSNQSTPAPSNVSSPSSVCETPSPHQLPIDSQGWGDPAQPTAAILKRVAALSDSYHDGLMFSAGNKYRITRWELLSRHWSEGPQTIEFRQADGSVDPIEIGENIRLYTALMRCAERAANDASEGPDRSPSWQIDEAEPTLQGLFDLLQLPANIVDYWTDRAQRLHEVSFYALREPEKLSCWQKCQSCSAARERRTAAHVKRGEYIKGWQAFLPAKTKGKKSTFTRKQKAAAKTRAKVKARKAERKRWIMDHSNDEWQIPHSGDWASGDWEQVPAANLESIVWAPEDQIDAGKPRVDEW